MMYDVGDQKKGKLPYNWSRYCKMFIDSCLTVYFWGTWRCISLCIRPWMKFMVYPSKYGIRIHLWCHKGTSGIWVTRLLEVEIQSRSFVKMFYHTLESIFRCEPLSRLELPQYSVHSVHTYLKICVYFVVWSWKVGCSFKLFHFNPKL